jgi:hypothetical protein
VAEARRRRIFTGLTLVTLGLALYGLDYLGDIDRSATFFLIGGAFLATYFYHRQFAFLIPACLFLGVGGTQFLDASPLLGLGGGLVGVTLVALIYEHRFHWWPLIPGTVLIVAGLERIEWVRLLFKHWPLLLVAVGVLLLIAAYARPGKS